MAKSIWSLRNYFNSDVSILSTFRDRRNTDME